MEKQKEQMKVLVIGSGGREHALVWSLARSSRVGEIFVAPGNAGTAGLAMNIEISSTDIAGLLDFARNEGVDLTVVGPEAPLVDGIADTFQAAGMRIFGPDSSAARLEGSKVFAKGMMKRYGIPTADYQVFSEKEPAIDYINKFGTPLVIKAEGLAAGKGVTVAMTKEEAITAVESALISGKYGSAGKRVIVEEYLEGKEVTVLAFTDGKTLIPMLSSRDHKQAFDRDQGPNTGGMGAFSPAPMVDQVLMERITGRVLIPTLSALQNEGIDFRGVIYFGLMIEQGEPKVLEYNVRFGDPETQVVLPLLQTDLLDIIEAVIDGKLADITVDWLSRSAVCVVLASGGYPLKYETGKEISGITQALTEPGINIFIAGAARRGEKLVTSGGRVLGVTACADDFSQAIDQAYNAVSKIGFEGVHYRSDIGQKALNTLKLRGGIK